MKAAANISAAFQNSQFPAARALGELVRAGGMCLLLSLFAVSPVLASPGEPTSQSSSPSIENQSEGTAQSGDASRTNPLDRTIPLPRAVMGLDVEEQVGRALPMELQFTNADGKVVTLGDYFKSNKPAVIAMVYYRCPVVCDVVMQQLTKTFNDVDLQIGRDFNVLYFSFDPSETAEDAASSRSGHQSNYNKPLTDEVKAGWQFHVTDSTTARALADAIGFKYRRLENGQYSHPAAIYLTTPEGKISRYFYGFSYPARDMKLGLIDASSGKLVRSLGDRIMSFCYMFDPNSGKYTLAAVRVMQVSGVISLAAVIMLVGALFVGERVRRRLWQSQQGGDSGGSSGVGPVAT
jgi:protein SCO1/2